MKTLLKLSMLSLGLIASASTFAQGACSVSYTTANAWGSGGQQDLVITNTSAAKTSWQLCWTFNGNEVINNLWNGSYTASGKMCASEMPVTTAICLPMAQSHLVLPTPMRQVQSPPASPSMALPAVAPPVAVRPAVFPPSAVAEAAVASLLPVAAGAAVASPLPVAAGAVVAFLQTAHAGY